MNAERTPSAPTVWILLGNKAGGNAELTSLAEALGWPFEAKQLRYNRLHRIPNLMLGASRISLDRHRASPLIPPWPSVVIGASRRSVPIARWIKKQSGGRAKLVHLHHTQVPWELFDLVITTPQYCLPVRPPILHGIAPLNRISPERLQEAATRWEPRLHHLPRPYTALLVGGNSSTYELDPGTAAELGRAVSADVRASGGTQLVSTSPRTPPAAAAALFAALEGPAHSYRWRPNDPDNPYLGYLALADRFIVTVDSASQVAEACLTNRPVAVFEWPPRPAPRFKLKGALRRRLERDRGTATPPDSLDLMYDRLVYCGLVKPTRNFAAYYQALMARGLVTRLGEEVNPAVRTPLTDMEDAVERIRELVSPRSSRTV